MSSPLMVEVDAASRQEAVPGSLTLSLLEDLKALKEVHSSWRAMQSHPNADIDFYRDIVSAWGERCRPHVLVVSREGSPETLLVGRAETVATECRIGYKTLLRMKARQLTFIYGGALGTFTSEHCALLIESVQSTLRQNKADLAVFHFIRTDSELCKALMADQTLPSFIPTIQLHRSTMIGSTVEETFRNLSSKRRRNLRGKKLQQEFEGRMETRCFHQLSDLQQMWADIESIAGKTYHRQLGVGFDGSEDLRNRLMAEASRGRLRAYVLYLAGQPAAFWIATAYQGRLFSDFMGYDPAFAKYSPGMFLIVRTLEGFCTSTLDSNITEVDWGLGDAQYKQVLGDTSWTEADVQILGSSLKGRVLCLVMVPIAKANGWLKAKLTDSGVLQRVKTTWRRSLVEPEKETASLE